MLAEEEGVAYADSDACGLGGGRGRRPGATFGRGAWCTSTDSGQADFVEANYTYCLYLMGSSSRGGYPPRFGGLLRPYSAGGKNFTLLQLTRAGKLR